MELTLKIIEIIGTFLGLWLILKQLKLNKKDYDSKFTYQKREKAVELAREFEKFIEHSLLIFNLISKTEIVNYMQKLDLDNGKNCLINFDIHELKKFFNDYESNKDKYNILSNIEKIAPQDIYMFMKDYDEDKYTQQKLEYFYSNSFKMFDLKKEIEDLKDKELKMYRLQYNTDLPFLWVVCSMIYIYCLLII